MSFVQVEKVLCGTHVTQLYNSWYIPKRFCILLQRYVHLLVYQRHLFNRKEMKLGKVFINRWLDNKNVVSNATEVYSPVKKKHEIVKCIGKLMHVENIIWWGNRFRKTHTLLVYCVYVCVWERGDRGNIGQETWEQKNRKKNEGNVSKCVWSKHHWD